MLAVTGRVVDFNRRQYESRRSLNPSKGFAQGSSVTAIQVDVIARCVCHVEAECVSDHERDRLGFELARVARAGSIVAVMQQLMRLCDDAHTRTYVLGLVMLRRLA